MTVIPISAATPGQVLAKPVLSEKGVPLCKEGLKLTASLIARFRDMGVDRLVVEGDPPSSSLGKETAETVSARFVRVEGDPLMDRIRDAVIEAFETLRPKVAETEEVEQTDGGLS